MANAVSTTTTINGLLSQDAVKKRFNEILGAKAAGFISSVINVTRSNKMLAEAEPKTVLGAAVIAATLDLPIDPNLGFAYIVPYRNKGIVEAQFQAGYKGFIQLAHRSARYDRINVCPIYEGELAPQSAWDRMTDTLNFTNEPRASDTVIGYAAYFRLVNGFEKPFYMTIDDIEAHALRFSQAYKIGKGPWKDHREQMMMKTPLKLLLSRWGILSTEMQTAIQADQSVVRDGEDGQEFDYVDGEIVEHEAADPDLNERLNGTDETATTNGDEQPNWEADLAPDGDAQ